MNRLAQFALLCSLLICLAASPCMAQSMPPGDYMAIDQYSVIYDNISQFQQAVLAQVGSGVSAEDQQILLATFCFSHSTIVILDHVSRSIGFTYASSQDPTAGAVSTQLMCTHYNYEYNALTGYGAQLDQFAAGGNPAVAPYASALRENITALIQIMGGQMQQYCMQ